MDISLMVAIAGVFACVAALTGAATFTVLERQSAGQRLFRERLQSPLRKAGVEATYLASDRPDPGLQRWSKLLPKSPKEMSRLQRRMATAGIHGSTPALVYVFSELAFAAIGFLIPVVALGWAKGLIFGLMGAILGYMIPSFVVSRRIALRKKQIDNGLPDALDLLIVCLEAGMGIDQAILKCAEELEIAYPALAEELRFVNVETRAGKPRIEAFKNFAARTKVDDVRALVSMLVQTDRFGTSVAQALRTHAEVSRTKRRQRAEERAAKVGVKLVFPLVFLLFPAFYVVTLGPAIIKFAEALGPGGALSGDF